MSDQNDKKTAKTTRYQLQQQMKKQYDKYKMTIAGVERELVKYPVNDKLDIAAFILFGDVEVTEKAAEALLKLCPEHDVVVSAEAKGIPICYEMARQGCREYVIARKSVKVYMRNCVSVEVNSITGESLAALEALMDKIGVNVDGKACILAEGDAKNRDDIIYLEELPLFFKD